MVSLFLSDFNCPPAKFFKSQEDSLLWLQKAYSKFQKNQTYTENDYARLLKRVGVDPEQIHQRGHFLEDFADPNAEKVFREHEVLGISTRQKEFLRITSGIFENIYQSREIPENLIHVTCTGYVSPSSAQLLAAKRSPQTKVTHSYHMGCYGAFPALRLAQGFFAQNPKERTDIVHTELCTLHLNPEDPSLEQMLVQTLFADGVAAYRLGGEFPNRGFELLHLGEFLIPDSASAMTWGISESGFQMSLSKDVPSLIAQNLRETLEKWEQQTQTFIRGLIKDAIIALHPGGPKIIDFVKDVLELREDQLKYSRQVLEKSGNMSSATVAHIWSEILKDESVQDGTFVLSLAFGPGLTVALNLMKVVSR